MTAGDSFGPYTFYTVTTSIGSTLSLRNSFDVSLGSAKDAFKLTAKLPNSCQPFGNGGSTTSTTSPPTTTTAPPTSVSTTTTSTSTTPPQTTGWALLGCYLDSTASRTLHYLASPPGGSAALTNAICQSTCQAAGFRLAGTEYSGECYCGNYISSTGGPAPDDSGCNMRCHGAVEETCGGPNRLSLSSLNGAAAVVEPVPASKPTVGGYKYLGCRTDAVYARVLTGSTYGDDGMTLEKCATFCSGGGFAVFGTEYGRECWCGAALSGSSAVAKESDCSQPCAGDAEEACGNGDRLSVYVKN